MERMTCTMRISDILEMSLANLWKRKMRTVLTVLGVVIGTASIVVMLSLGLGLKEAMLAQVGSAGGLTEILVYSEIDYGSEALMLDDSTIETFSNMDYVEKVQPMLIYSMPFQIGNYEGYMELIGADSDYLSMIELGEGDYPEQGSGLSMIVGNQLIMSLMDSTTGEWVDFESEELPNVDFMTTPVLGGIEKEETYSDDENVEGEDSGTYSEENSIFAVEEDFSLGGTGSEDSETDEDFSDEDSFEGEYGLEDEFDSFDNFDESESFSFFSSDTKKVPIDVSGVTAGDTNTYTEFSYYCYTDIEILKSFLKEQYPVNSVIPGQPTDQNGKPYRDLKYSQFIVKVDEADNVELVLEEIQNLGYQAEANKEWLEEIEKEFMIIEAVLGGIGAVAMLVAAISIANTMTMSIYERTKEIGVMKVLGCGLGNIRSMFLTEAAFIGFIGGVVGLLLSYTISFVLNQFVAPYFMSDYGANVDISSIPLWLCMAALGFSTVVGMIAGFFPAQRATRLSPLAAIRNE